MPVNNLTDVAWSGKLESESEKNVATCVLRSAPDFVEMKYIRTSLIGALAVLAGCAWLAETPEEAAARIAREREAARLVALPVTTAPCGELARRAAEANAAITNELRNQEHREACRTWNPANPRAIPPTVGGRQVSCWVVAEPRSTALEQALIATIAAEQARRCP